MDNYNVRISVKVSKMTGKGDGQGESVAKLEKSIGCIKYTLFCFNVVAWVSNNFQLFVPSANIRKV